MKYIMVFFVAVAFGCAIPVRPIAYLEQDKTGKYHFVPDDAQEPHVEEALGFIAPFIKIAGGPYGEAALGVLALVLGHQVGHRRGKKAAKAKTNAQPTEEVK